MLCLCGMNPDSGRSAEYRKKNNCKALFIQTEGQRKFNLASYIEFLVISIKNYHRVRLINLRFIHAERSEHVNDNDIGGDVAISMISEKTIFLD